MLSNFKRKWFSVSISVTQYTPANQNIWEADNFNSDIIVFIASNVFYLASCLKWLNFQHHKQWDL